MNLFYFGFHDFNSFDSNIKFIIFNSLDSNINQCTPPPFSDIHQINNTNTAILSPAASNPAYQNNNFVNTYPYAPPVVGVNYLTLNGRNLKIYFKSNYI